MTALFFIVDQDIDALRTLANLVVAGTVRPVIGERFQLATAAKRFNDRSASIAGKAVLAFR